MTTMNKHILAVATSFYKDKPIAGNGEYQIEFVITKYLINPGVHSINISFVDVTGNSTEYLLNTTEILSFIVNDNNFRRDDNYVQGFRAVQFRLFWKFHEKNK
jgi:hypothetical protein